jgi:molybdopterin-guanine dinucleotide biosynthesis protein B
MIPIVCIVGASNSGKTTFLEKLIPELAQRGYRIGTVKHDVHGFEMDQKGKDTWRHRKAGAQTIGISSPYQVATIRQISQEMDLKELVTRYFWQEDMVVTEGYKRSHFPKIEVFRSAVEDKPICGLKDNLIAVVTDDAIDLEVPTFRVGEARQVADLIENCFLKERKQHNIVVNLDGKRLPIKEFVRDFLMGGIVGMLSNLKGWQKPTHIDIHIRMEDE